MLAGRWVILASNQYQSTLLSITISASAILGISEDEMQQKTKRAASDPEHVNTEPCPEKGDDLPTPKRGAFPTPKAIIESAPRYIPEGSEIESDESVTEPVSSTNAEKKRHDGAK
jgi:hypothetical protein